MAISAGTIEALLRLRDEMSPALKRVGRSTQQLGSTMQGAGQAMLPMSAALLALGGGAIKAQIDFENSFTGVRKTVNATEEEFAELAQGFRDMAKEIPVSVNELNSIGEAAGQLGIETENIVEFTRTMADLGETTNLSATDAATQMARLANIMQTPQDKFEELGSTIVDLGNNLETTEAEIVEFGLRLAGAGKVVGLSEAEVLSIAGALSSLGIKAEAGGTAMSRVMRDMAKAVSGGGEELQAFADAAGVSSAGFVEAFETDAAGAITTFIEGLGRLDQKELFAALEDLGLDTERVGDMLLRASGAGDSFANALSIGTAAFRENSALSAEAAQRYGTMESQLKILWGQVKDVAISLGEALMPALQTGVELFAKLVPLIEKAVQWFSGLDQPTQMVIIAMGGLAIVLPPLIIAIGAVVAGVGAIAAGFAAASPVVLTIVGVVAAVGAALAGAAAAWLVWGDDVVAAARGAFEGVKGWLVDAWNSDIVQAFVGLAQSLAELFGAAMELVVAVAEKAYNGIKGWLADKLGPVFELLQPVLDAMVEGFRMWKEQSIAQVKALVDLVRVHLVDRLGRIVSGVKERIDRVTGFFRDMKDAVVGNSYVPEMVEGVRVEMEKLPGLMSVPAAAATTSVTQSFGSLKDQVLGKVEELGQGLISKLGGLFGGGGLLSSLMGAGLSSLFGPGGLMMGIAQKGLAALQDLIGKGLGKVGEFVKGLFGGPSGEELEGRDLVAGFEDAIIGTLDATQQAEAGGERWKQVVIGVRDAYIAAGRTAAEAEAAVEKLWQSSKEGPEATRAAIAEIEAVAGDALFAAEGAAEAAGASTDALAQGLAEMDPEALAATSEAAQDAAAATTSAAEGLDSMAAGAETATTGIMALTDAVRSYTAAVLGVPTDITFPSPGGAGTPVQSFDIGGIVPRDMLAKVHRGEVVVPPREPRRSEVMREAGIGGGGASVTFQNMVVNLSGGGGDDARKFLDRVAQMIEQGEAPRFSAALRG